MVKIKDRIRATIECIRYPFLYPRHRMTGLHYNNWKLRKYYQDNYFKANGYVYVHVVTEKDFADMAKNKEMFATISGVTYHVENVSPSSNSFEGYKYIEQSVVITKGRKTIGRINLSELSDNLTNDDVDICFTDNNSDVAVSMYIVIPSSVPIKEQAQRFFIKKYTRSWLWKVKLSIAIWIHNNPLQWLHCIPSYTEWDAMRQYKGWYKTFGDELLTRMAYQIKKDGMWRTFRITDIKEKYGSLRIYTGPASSEMYQLLSQYEDISYHTCIDCGKPATKLSGGYILPFCDDCFAKQYDNYVGPMAVIDENGQWKYVDDAL